MKPRAKIKPKKPTDWWWQGGNARRAGADVDANPYPRNTGPFYRWREGWEYEDQEMARV